MRNVLRLRPSFFFTDKESIQISAIQEVFGLNPSLRLWHLKRAVNEKRNECSRMAATTLFVVCEKYLLSKMEKHYFETSFISRKSCETLWQDTVDELELFLVERQ